MAERQRHQRPAVAAALYFALLLCAVSGCQVHVRETNDGVHDDGYEQPYYVRRQVDQEDMSKKERDRLPR